MADVRIVIAAIAVAVHLGVILRAILLEGREPYARAAWLLLMVALPGIGTIAYLLFGEPWTSAGFRRRAREAGAALRPYAPARSTTSTSAEATNAFATAAAAMRWPTATACDAKVAPDSDAAIAMIVADIDAAERYLHLSFYIWLCDHNGTAVVEAVCRAARRGVACRIVADAIGSRAMIRSAAWRAMRDAGARLCASLRAPYGLGALAGHRTDLRNHRKIVVIDGRVTYAGSQNCADPAFLVKARYAPWVDILIRYEGPIVRQADLIFAAAWTAETGEDLRGLFAAEPMPVGASVATDGGFPAIAVGTGPLSPRGTMTDLFVAVLAAAGRTATVTTPYFAPDPPLLAALIAAARRGVELTIVFPHRNDSRVIGAISRAYYPGLAAAGARILEYRGGLLHAKTLVVDDALALVGSANMDRRSLDLNFENNVLFESPALAAEVGLRQRAWIADAIEIDHGGLAARSLPRRFLDNLLTMAAPLF